MIVEAELAKLRRFQSYLRLEEKLIFDDLIASCKRYAPYASTMVYTIKEVPLIISMLFGQQKRLVSLEKRLMTLETIIKKSLPAESIAIAQTSTTAEAAAVAPLTETYGGAVFQPAEPPVTGTPLPK